MYAGNHYIPKCINHTDSPISSICVSNGCFLDFCKYCLAEHSKLHKSKGIYMDLVSFEDLRLESRQKLVELLELMPPENQFSTNPTEKMLSKLRHAREQISAAIESKFKVIEQTILSYDSSDRRQKVTEAREELNNDYKKDRSAFQQKLKDLIDAIDSSTNDSALLAALKECNNRNLKVDWDSIESKYTSKIDQASFYVANDIDKSFDNWLTKNCKVLNLSNSSFELPSDTIADDLIIEGILPCSISKNSGLSTASNFIGMELMHGKHRWTISLDQIQFTGWVSIGVIDTKDVPLKGNIYSKAICICSDGTNYNISLTDKHPMKTGDVYTITADTVARTVHIQSDGGMKGEWKNIPVGKVLHPFIEIHGNHKVSVLSYEYPCA